METVSKFSEELFRRAPLPGAQWRHVEIHNLGQSTTSAENGSIKASDSAVVIATAHADIPSPTSLTRIRSETGAFVIPGMELPVSLRSWHNAEDRVTSDFYFHLILGFDPAGSWAPEYWRDTIFNKHQRQSLPCGDRDVFGLSESLDEILTLVNDDPGVIAIPAFRHSSSSAWKDRPVQQLFNDPAFIGRADRFCAIEVDANVANGYLAVSEGGHLPFIRAASQDGPQGCFAQMEKLCFTELKAAFDVPFRTLLQCPDHPDTYVVGVRIVGQFFKDLWVTLSPNANVFIGVRGSGKTALLESLRFVLGAPVPNERSKDIRAHLRTILGESGSVTALVQTAEGLILVTRTIADPRFHVLDECDQCFLVEQLERKRFPVQILGWHEIEQIATNKTSRLDYLDALAGRDQISTLDRELERKRRELGPAHRKAARQFAKFRNLHAEIVRLRAMRQGLRDLEDAKLIQLKKQYQAGQEDLELLRGLPDRLQHAIETVTSAVKQLRSQLVFDESKKESPLREPVSRAQKLLDDLVKQLDEAVVHEEAKGSWTRLAKEVLGKLDKLWDSGRVEHAKFAERYDIERSSISPENRRILDEHRKVSEETRMLGGQVRWCDNLKRDVEELLSKLVELSSRVADALQTRTEARRSGALDLNKDLDKRYGVRLSVVKAPQSGKRFLDEAGAVVLRLLSKEGHVYRKLSAEYLKIKGAMDPGQMPEVFDEAFSDYLGHFLEDDLKIEFRVGKDEADYKRIDRLSAGQRCTALFPFLLHVGEGPLVVDQLEDNLDNRYISDVVAPALQRFKRKRQLIFSTHNANLAVLCDPECIAVFEATGSESTIRHTGFLASPDSVIAGPVLETLDGGERALQLRLRRYGRIYRRPK